MGMFDYLRVEPALPGDWQPPEGYLFQTKDLDCEMETHRITADGRLLVTRIVGHQDVPESEWRYRDAKPGSIEAIWHENSKARPIRQEFEELWHGYIHFTGEERLKPMPKPPRPMTSAEMREYIRFRCYRAKFTDGRLVEITGGVETV